MIDFDVRYNARRSASVLNDEEVESIAYGRWNGNKLREMDTLTIARSTRQGTRMTALYEIVGSVGVRVFDMHVRGCRNPSSMKEAAPLHTASTASFGVVLSKWDHCKLPLRTFRPEFTWCSVNSQCISTSGMPAGGMSRIGNMASQRTEYSARIQMANRSESLQHRKTYEPRPMTSSQS